MCPWTGTQQLSSIAPNGQCGRGDTERDTEQQAEGGSFFLYV